MIYMTYLPIDDKLCWQAGITPISQPCYSILSCRCDDGGASADVRTYLVVHDSTQVLEHLLGLFSPAPREPLNQIY